MRKPRLVLLLLTTLVVSARAQTLNPSFPGFNGPVSALAASGNTVYVAGGFNYVGASTGAGVPIDLASGAVLAGAARVDGSVYAAIPDGGGGWYIGGSFTSVAGAQRFNLARIH